MSARNFSSLRATLFGSLLAVGSVACRTSMDAAPTDEPTREPTTAGNMPPANLPPPSVSPPGVLAPTVPLPSSPSPSEQINGPRRGEELQPVTGTDPIADSTGGTGGSHGSKQSGSGGTGGTHGKHGSGGTGGTAGTSELE